MLYSIQNYPYIQARMSFQAILGEIPQPLKLALFKSLFRLWVTVTYNQAARLVPRAACFM